MLITKNYLYFQIPKFSNFQISTNLLGASGGGGGGGRGTITIHGGGGGGGGGGAIRITANSIIFRNGSVISVKGGNGADGVDIDGAFSGAGGTGSGGTINLQSKIISGFTKRINSDITGGKGGAGGTSFYGTGGNGSLGRLLIEHGASCITATITQQPKSPSPK